MFCSVFALYAPLLTSPLLGEGLHRPVALMNPPMISPHAITRLTLQSFRNYPECVLEVAARPVVLRGVNGAGKTNILEAISLLMPGRGFRHARFKAMDTADSTTPWVVAAQVITRGEQVQLGTGRDGSSASDKRLIRINGEKARSAAALAEHVAISWVTPAMDPVFVSGNTPRRALLDRLVYGFFPDHAARVMEYEKAMRERNRLLGETMRYDPHWLTVIERQMAETSVAITLARLEVIARLQALLERRDSQFPRAEISLRGEVENLLATGGSSLAVEGALAERFAQSRAVDAARGRAMVGAHRSEWQVVHAEKNREAAECSTGEQKALLLSLVLAAATARAEACGQPPILLLDEVIAHLDSGKRQALFTLIRESGIQAWMTGTDAGDFAGVDEFSTVIEIAGGIARVC